MYNGPCDSLEMCDLILAFVCRISVPCCDDLESRRPKTASTDSCKSLQKGIQTAIQNRDCVDLSPSSSRTRHSENRSAEAFGLLVIRGSQFELQLANRSRNLALACHHPKEKPRTCGTHGTRASHSVVLAGIARLHSSCCRREL